MKKKKQINLDLCGITILSRKKKMKRGVEIYIFDITYVTRILMTQVLHHTEYHLFDFMVSDLIYFVFLNRQN